MESQALQYKVLKSLSSNDIHSQLVGRGVVLPDPKSPGSKQYYLKMAKGSIKTIPETWEKNLKIFFHQTIKVDPAVIFLEIAFALGYTEGGMTKVFGFDMDNMLDKLFLLKFISFVQPSHPFSEIFMEINKTMVFEFGDELFETFRISKNSNKRMLPVAEDGILDSAQLATVKFYSDCCEPLIYARNEFSAVISNCKKFMKVARKEGIEETLEKMLGTKFYTVVTTMAKTNLAENVINKEEFDFNLHYMLLCSKRKKKYKDFNVFVDEVKKIEK